MASPQGGEINQRALYEGGTLKGSTLRAGLTRTHPSTVLLPSVPLLPNPSPHHQEQQMLFVILS